MDHLTTLVILAMISAYAITAVTLVLIVWRTNAFTNGLNGRLYPTTKDIK